MKIKNVHKIGFEGRPQYRYKTQLSSLEENYNTNENYQFVVPWQMAKTKENEFILK
jgi:hypothetical protein